MKRKLLFACLFFITMHSFSQEDAWIYLSDKPNSTASINNPISIMTQDAIDRKGLHNIAIDERDVPVDESYISTVKSQNGISVLAKSKWMNAVHVRGTQTDITATLALAFVDSIEYADKGLNSRQSETMPNKFEVPLTDRADFNYGSAANQVEMINADDLHLADYTGEGMVIAVLDAGFPNVNTMGAFQRLRDAGKLLNGYDFVNRTAEVYSYSGNSHGTLVLSDMAGFVQDQFVGTAPDASYYVFRTEDAASENPIEESLWVEAAERADSLGVDIINTSLGYKTYDNPNYSHTNADINGATAFITRGANIAFEKGMLLVNSAGNSGTSGLNAPADSAGVLTVAAVDAMGEYASFSSQGSAIQPTHKPDVAAKGLGSAVVNENNTVTTSNGTSFSSPIMAGGVASLWQAVPDLTNAQIMQIIRESSSQFNSPDFLLGYGIPNLQQALSMALSIQESESQSQEIRIFPNPAKTFINLDYAFQDNEVVNLSIFNMLGKRVMVSELNLNNRSMRISSLANGIYLANLETASGSKTFKLIKE